MSLKRHRRPVRQAQRPLRIQWQGRVIVIRADGRMLFPWRLSPRQRRRLLEHTKTHALPGPAAVRGYRSRLRSRRGKAWRNR